MSNTLNLARKLRPKTFQDVVGQDIAISMLRNSLYKNHFFPLYLFAGQKGCGKTSTARILATAINCEALASFQAAPTTQTLPCLTCASCLRMASGNHPDFIEIDAASHTGVDDVRLILESCTFMPLMGGKKIYLIDEAHMLSKAAFNALLKILEEPPTHALFMMATTEMLKIPDTIRSRAFQLHFAAIKDDTLNSLLSGACTTEHIPYQTEALSLIIHETEGSARDALNLLEQVRFAHSGITIDNVRSVLGIISAQRMGELLALMLEKNIPALLKELALTQQTTLNAGRLWHLLIGVIRTLIWQSYNVTPTSDALLLPAALSTRIASAAHAAELHRIVHYLWQQEELFLATPYKHAFLEKIFLDICHGISTSPTTSINKQLAPAQSPVARKQETHGSPAAAPPAVHPSPLKAPPQPSPIPWHSVCSAIAKLGDPILSSIFNQARVTAVDESSGTVTLALPQASRFFIEKIHEMQPHWKPILQTHFNGCSSLTITAELAQPRQHSTPVSTPILTQTTTDVSTRPQPAPQTPKVETPKTVSIPAPRPTSHAAPSLQKPAYQAKPKQLVLASSIIRGTTLILNDDNTSQWPYTALLYRVFSGKLEIISPDATQ